jgi:uncharacterized coiled-coil DUF342 family protein
MNKERRKALTELHKRLDDLRVEFEDIHDELKSAKDEEQEYFDAMPESFQQGEQGQRAEEVIQYLDTALDGMEGFDFGEVMAAIDEASA